MRLIDTLFQIVTRRADARPVAIVRMLVGLAAIGFALEAWVNIARSEFKRRPDTWIVAVRPGLVRTDSAKKSLEYDKELYPRVNALRQAFDSVGVDPDLGGLRIWKALPPQPDRALISFDGSIDEKPTI